MDITLEIEGMEEINSILQKKINELNNLEPILEVFADDLKNALDKQWDNESDLFGIPWVEHSNATIEIRKKKGITKSAILDEYGGLRKSIKVDVDGNKITISTNIPYAKIQDQGGSITVFGKKKSKIPARHFFLDDASDIPKQLIDDFIAKLIWWLQEEH